MRSAPGRATGGLRSLGPREIRENRGLPTPGVILAGDHSARSRALSREAAAVALCPTTGSPCRSPPAPEWSRNGGHGLNPYHDLAGSVGGLNPLAPTTFDHPVPPFPRAMRPRGSRPTRRGPQSRWLVECVPIPPGAPLFPCGCPSPILAEAANASFPECRRRRKSLCQMPSPSARIVRCSPRPN